MAKNIVICSDGTGNTAIKGRGTNVFKLFEGVDLNGHRWDPSLKPQVALYDDGVGSEDFKPLRILGGAAGYGLSKNVRQLYKELSRVYDDGDKIYLFGFSRGAFTVRSLVGMISTCGLVNPKHAPSAEALERLVQRAYSAYRASYRTALQELFRGKASRHEGHVFRERWSVPYEPVLRFVGVWDTVDAVGLPFHLSDIINKTVYRFKFPDPFLSDKVKQACHALSIDDDRDSFRPLVWDERADDGRIEQVWFAGVHSNVGGGYPKQGMSLVALDWMMAKAEAAGLRFNCNDRETYREHSSADDRLYNPRAGLGTFYRWKPRDVENICMRNHMPIRIHISAVERIAHGVDDYAPENLPPHITVVTTPPDPQQDPTLISQRAANVETVFNGATSGRSLLHDLRRTVFVGRLSYYVFLSACTVALAGLIVMGADGWMPRALVRSTGRLLAGTVTSPWTTMASAVKLLWQDPPLLIAIVLALVTSSIMARWSDSRIASVSSAFWHQHQATLRSALKVARTQVSPEATDDSGPLCWASGAHRSSPPAMRTR